MSQKNATDYVLVYTQDELTCAYPHTEVSELNYGEALLGVLNLRKSFLGIKFTRANFCRNLYSEEKTAHMILHGSFEARPLARLVFNFDNNDLALTREDILEF